MQGKRPQGQHGSRAVASIRVEHQAPAMGPETMTVAESEEPPGSRCQAGSGRHPLWKDVPLSQWEDWRWQMQNAVRTTAQLAELLPLPTQKLAALAELESKYKLALPPYYLSLIDREAPYDDPIGRQSLPHPDETVADSQVELEDPLEEDKDSPVPGLTHRYPDRVLLVTTPVCSMYCRFCTRKRVTMDREGWDAPSHDEVRMIEYVRAHEEIHDCILSGGDALMLPEAKLRWFLTELAAIPHVDVIRVGTRVPVTLPQKLFDPRWIEVLRETGKVWVQTHFNHPREITPEAARGCRNLINAGMPINNHAVLLKGVNDSVVTMRELVRGLLRIKVRPYYLFHCDPVVGAGHFRTSVWKGLEIMEGLRGHVSGLGVPTYVIDGLYGAGKIPLRPNYLISAASEAVVLRNYEGMIFRYAPEDQHGPPSATAQTTGVSELLSGGGGRLMPEGNRRMKRRQQHAEQPAQPVAETTIKGPAAVDSAAPSSAIVAQARRLDRKSSAKVPAAHMSTKSAAKSAANGQSPVAEAPPAATRTPKPARPARASAKPGVTRKATRAIVAQAEAAQAEGTELLVGIWPAGDQPVLRVLNEADR